MTYWQPVLEFVLAVISLAAAALLLPVITFGRVRVEPPDGNLKFPWHGIHRASDGTIFLHFELAAIVGAVLLVAVFVVGFFIWAK